MKKSLIALAITTTAVASAASAAPLYSQDGNSIDMGGRAEARLSMQDGKVADNSRVRLNFLGKVAIQDDLYGVGFYEGEFTTADNGQEPSDAGSTIDNRYLYAGIGGNFGEVTYGKNDGALGVITDFTDIMAYHGNSAADKLAAADRSDNMLTYKGAFNDLSVKASYRFADRGVDATDPGKYGDNGQDGYSLSGIYAVGDSGVKLGGGYAAQDSADEFMLAASYAMDNMYFGATYTDGDKAYDSSNKGDYRGYELAAAYTLMEKTVFTATYNNAETNSETSADNLAFDATYYFQPNFRAYASYNVNLISKGDTMGEVSGTGTKQATSIDSQDELALGLRYDF